MIKVTTAFVVAHLGIPSGPRGENYHVRMHHINGGAASVHVHGIARSEICYIEYRHRRAFGLDLGDVVRTYTFVDDYHFAFSEIDLVQNSVQRVCLPIDGDWNGA